MLIGYSSLDRPVSAGRRFQSRNCTPALSEWPWSTWKTQVSSLYHSHPSARHRDNLLGSMQWVRTRSLCSDRCPFLSGARGYHLLHSEPHSGFCFTRDNAQSPSKSFCGLRCPPSTSLPLPSLPSTSPPALASGLSLRHALSQRSKPQDLCPWWSLPGISLFRGVSLWSPHPAALYSSTQRYSSPLCS